MCISVRRFDAVGQVRDMKCVIYALYCISLALLRRRLHAAAAHIARFSLLC